MSKCDRCIAPKANKDENICLDCRDNPIVERILASLPHISYYTEYIPVCPRGYADCVNDPAYILCYYPDWYKELYGNKTPFEALWEKNGCMDRYQNDPDEKYYCYDDEDK